MIPPVTETFPVRPTEGAVELHVNVNSSVFQRHENGGLRMVCMTRFALVLAGSSRLPMPDGRLKLKRFANSIESNIVYVEIATVSPCYVLSFDSIFFSICSRTCLSPSVPESGRGFPLFEVLNWIRTYVMDPCLTEAQLAQGRLARAA